jgi:hypothetical protein
MRDGPHLPFESLDFIYTPSADVAGDVQYFTEVLGAELVFAIEAFGTRVAMVRLSEQPPRILFAGHLEGERAILVFRVAGNGAIVSGFLMGPGARSRLRAATASRSTS